MRISLRGIKNEETNEFFSLKNNDADLSNYRDQLSRERTARTLTLRMSQRPMIAQMFSKPANDHLKSPLIDIDNFPFLNPSYAINQLNNGNQKTLPDFLTSITICAQQTPRLIMNLVKDDGISESFMNALNAEHSEQINIMLIKALTVIFPILGEKKVQYVDNGLCMCLFEFLSSQSVPILEASIALTDVIAESSGYGRDCLLCFNIHQFLIDIALAEKSEQLTLQACEALNKIFMNKQQIESTVLSECVNQIVPLLSLHSIKAVNVVLMCLVSMTNQMQALVFTLYDLNLFPTFVSMLKNPDLVSAALPLIGNISVGHADQITTLLNCGIFDALLPLINSEYTADVFWVLSNIVESVPHITIGLFNIEFIEKTVDIAQSSSYAVMKESTFFLATLVIFTETDDIPYFMNDRVIDLFIQMLGCGVFLIILRSLDALIRFWIIFKNKTYVDQSVIAILEGEDIHSRLTELIEMNYNHIQERAEFLLNEIDSETSKLVM